MSEAPLTPPPGENPETIKSETPQVDTALGSKRMKRSLWKRIGAGGLSVSIAIHILLIFIAAIFVVSTTMNQQKKDPNAFATGAGGGSGGERVKQTQHKIQPKNVKSLAKTTTRITSKSASASITLPDMPSSASASSMISGAMATGASKGFGGGAGGGIGAGKGMGSGGGKNFVAKPVMGANIFAQRLAVYFDASASMLPYLERVEQEIRVQFPDADVYLGNGQFIDVWDGEVVGGEKFKGAAVLNRPTTGGSKKNAKGDIVETETNPAKLTSAGRNIFKKYAANFKKGSVGAWLDVLKDDRTYDALIIFSDFQDGIRQVRTKGYKPDKGMRPDPPTVFTDRANTGLGIARSAVVIASSSSSGQAIVKCADTTGLLTGMFVDASGIAKGSTITEIKPNVSFTLDKALTGLVNGKVNANNGGDKRTPDEKKWEEEWIKAFDGARDGKGPHLYLLSTSRASGNRPGTVLQRCVAASEGSAILLKFGSAKKGEGSLNDLHNYDDLYVGMPVTGKGVPPNAEITAMPTFKEIIDPEDPEKKRKKRVVDQQLKISVVLTDDVNNGVFAFHPLVQASGTLTKGSKALSEVSATADLKPGMTVVANAVAKDTRIVSIAPIKGTSFVSIELSSPATADAPMGNIRFRPLDSSAGGGARNAAPAR